MSGSRIAAQPYIKNVGWSWEGRRSARVPEEPTVGFILISNGANMICDSGFTAAVYGSGLQIFGSAKVGGLGGAPFAGGIGRWKVGFGPLRPSSSVSAEERSRVRFLVHCRTTGPPGGGCMPPVMLGRMGGAPTTPLTRRSTPERLGGGGNPAPPRSDGRPGIWNADGRLEGTSNDWPRMPL